VIYRYIHSLSKTNYIPSTVYLDTTSASCDESKAKLFNHYFHSVFNKPSQPIPNSDVTRQQHQHNSLNSFTITETEVFEVLSQLDTSKAVGIDGIGPRVLKHCAMCHCLIHYVNYLIYVCLLDPFHKSGKRI